MTTMIAVAGRLRSRRGPRVAIGLLAAVVLTALGAWLVASGIDLVDTWSTVAAAGSDALRTSSDAGFQVMAERYATPATPPYGQVFARFAVAGAAMVVALRLGLHAFAPVLDAPRR